MAETLPPMSLTALSSGFLAPTEDDTWAPPSLTNRCAMASPNAAVSAADDCKLAFPISHDGSFSSRHRFVWGCG